MVQPVFCIVDAGSCFVFSSGHFVVTWAEKHNHAANKDGFEKRKAKTDLINAIVASGNYFQES